MFTIFLPVFNPVAIDIGFFGIRWYALAYIFGLILGIIYTNYLEKTLKLFSNQKQKKKFLEDYFFAIALGIIIGGRLGYILFYNFSYYLSNPLQIFYIWQGGMSFHGGLLGCTIAIFCLSKIKKINLFTLSDITVAAAPIGLFFGRLANFINQELVGRYTSMPWGVVFAGHSIPRHPSEIYEAILEGIVLFFIILVLWKKYCLYLKPGCITGVFLILYGCFRIFSECFREPDPQIGFIAHYFTLGQILSTFMIIAGWVIFYINSKKK